MCNMPTPAGLVQQHLSPKTNTPGTDRRKFIQVHFPSPLSLCKCDGKQLHPWGLAFCWPRSMSMDGPFLSLLSDALLSEMETCVCETLSGCPFHRPSLPTPILIAPGRGLELCFLIVFPKNITTATYWVNPPPSVQGVRREGNVGLISPGIFWVLCPSHETGRFEDPFLPLYLMGSWQCCQSYLSHQHYILLQSVGQGQQYIKQGGEFVHFATCLFLSLLNLLICHPL